MKSLILAGLMVLSSNVFASKLISIKSLTNTKLDAASSELIGTELVTHSAVKKVLELKGKGTTAQEIRLNTVAQALHSVCGFFDDGVSIALNSKDEKGILKAVADLTDSSSLDKGDDEYKKVVKDVTVFSNEAGVEVYSGSASGNNTMGTVLGLYDTKTNEVAVFASTNCGSDD